MIKKIISLFLCMLLCITGFSVFVNAAETNNMSIIFQINNPNMTVNGVQKQIDRKNGISPIIRNGRTLLHC